MPFKNVFIKCFVVRSIQCFCKESTDFRYFNINDIKVIFNNGLSLTYYTWKCKLNYGLIYVIY